MSLLLPSHLQQIPLIQFVHNDDLLLLKDDKSEWFSTMYYLDWLPFREIGALYYDALAKFNVIPAKINEPKGVPTETQESAKQRLMFERTTMQESEAGKTDILYPNNPTLTDLPHTTKAVDIAPGMVPLRVAGRKPKCFFSMLKAFLGSTLLGRRPNPDEVDELLRSNPTFARVCGFSPKRMENYDEYAYDHIPGERKLQQFDQIMTQAGLWSKIKVMQVNENLTFGVIEMENEIVGDTTHYPAHSSFETLKYQDESNKEKKKSQSKTTKNCGCEDWNECGHPWILRDDGAGSVAKSGGKLYWAHKASILGFPGQGVILDLIAVSDGATHDGQTFLPHVDYLFETYPDVHSCVSRVIYDSVCDDVKLKALFEEKHQVELKASLNPRRKKDITENLPRGIEKITPFGNPICLEGHEMDYKGIRYETQHYIYEAPLQENGEAVCTGCPQRSTCCKSSTKGSRTITISFDLLPQIDANDPPMAKRFKTVMKRRTSVERMIKRIKCDFSDERLTKRGNASFQAFLDKSLIAYHLLLKHLH